MTPNSKDRIKVASLGILLLIGLLFIGFMILGKPAPTGEITNMVKIIAADDTERIDACKKNNTSYAHKLKENDKFFLEYHSKDTGKYTLTKQQYDKLDENEYYYFKIKYSSSKDTSSGTVKSIYTENPTQR